VGKTIGSGFQKNLKDSQVLWNDKFKAESAPLEDVVKNSEIIFICVPTPMHFDERGIDLSIVKEVVDYIVPFVENTQKCVVIKSTVAPGTTKEFQEKYPNVQFAMNPEFLTEKSPDEDFQNAERTVIGVEKKEVGVILEKLYKDFYGKNAQIFVTDTTTAEVIKYMSNIFLAAKVMIANEFFELSEKLGIDYEDVWPAVAIDKRIGASHIRVSPERGFGGKCFPKDTVALLGKAKEVGVDMKVIKAVWEKNLEVRKVKDWETIEGAVTR
jgi:UDPglucose 6-dehydrogenase